MGYGTFNYTNQYLLGPDGNPLNPKSESDHSYRFYRASFHHITFIDKVIKIYVQPDVPIKVQIAWTYLHRPPNTSVVVGVDFNGDNSSLFV